MIAVEQAPPEVQALRAAIGALSRYLFDADWHEGCEHPIWEALSVEGSAWRNRSDPELLRELGHAWMKVGGWVVWDEHFGRLVWLTNAEWQRALREHWEVS